MTQVQIENVTKMYGNFTAVDGVSVDIPDPRPAGLRT